MEEVTNALVAMIEERLDGSIAMLEEMAAKTIEWVGASEVPQMEEVDLEAVAGWPAGSGNGLGDTMNPNIGDWGWEDLVSVKVPDPHFCELTLGRLRCMNPVLSSIFSALTRTLAPTTRDTDQGDRV